MILIIQSLKSSFNKFQEANLSGKVKICLPFTLKMILFIELIVFLSFTLCIMKTFDAFEYILLLVDILIIITDGFHGLLKHNPNDSKWYNFFL